ncbi:acyl-CoA dehydrogenase family protein [Nocardia sp. CDC160]|uniref:acyl-CoA dehydrogenase family protein n=1 Tax=Nocardia sp. CDC160 TaxID=3112166 RepID=UPI002DBF2C76|nr:acyl-CoA dehydrogenase family protein [Nocardia sp. CDC160]MEC3915631.1 acyl-CoA dehydrogenase family protein [Nocardia sp. CDC160]
MYETPAEIQATLDALDAFLAAEIQPLEQANPQFFDHRREYARTDFDNDGRPRAEWVALIVEMRRRAEAAGWFRYGLPKELGGRGASNLEMAYIREHLGLRGIGLHDDPLYESAVVGNFPVQLAFHAAATEEQKREWLEAMIVGERRVAMGLTEPNVGSDLLRMETTAIRDGDDWIIDGVKRWQSGMDVATHNLVFARTAGNPGEPLGITAFIVPTDAPGFDTEFFWWTMNMPSDHAEITLNQVRVPHSAMLGQENLGLLPLLTFVHDQRMRQAAQSLGAAQYCINEAVDYANARLLHGKPLSRKQAIRFALAELHTEAAMVRGLIRDVAAQLDSTDAHKLSHLVAMCNYRANRLACAAADQAMQTCGGVGYSRHMPFEHIYRRHRRYRITEGADELQLKEIAKELFGSVRGDATRRDPRAWPAPR